MSRKEEQSDQAPQKKVVPKKKVQSKKKRTPKRTPKRTKDEDILKMSTMAAYLGKMQDDMVRDRRNITTMCALMEEYLSCYIVIGYTIDGKPVSITNAKEPKDYDSLSTALQRFLIEGTYGPCGPFDGPGPLDGPGG